MKSIITGMKNYKKLMIDAHPAAKDAPKAKAGKEEIEEFKQRFDKAILDSADTSRNVEIDGFHPSALGTAFGKCSRYSVYLLRGEEKAPIDNARTLRIFATGHSAHEIIQNYLKYMAENDLIKEFDSEVKIESNDPPVRGHADGTLTLWNGKKILLEIKTANDEVFSNRRRWKKAKPEHFAQANIYGFILGIEVCWILYWNKNNCEIEIFEYKIDHVAAEKQILKWRKVHKAYEDGKLPVRPYKETSKSCIYCPMREKCWADSDEGVKI